MKRTASGAKNSRSSGSSARRSAPRGRSRHVVCLSNQGYIVSLERRKIYVALPDRQAHQLGLVRVIDESGEDYLFPKTFFADIKLSPHLAKALAGATQ